MTEHLGHVEVEGTDAVALLEGEVGIARGLAHDIQRSTLALGNLADVIDVFLLNQQAHALLTFVGDDFLAGERRVADGQLGHIDEAAALLHEFAQAVHMTCRAVVMDADDGVDIFFAERTHEVVSTLLHLRVGTLHSIQLDAAAVAACIYTADGAAAETDAVVVAAHDDNLVALLGRALQTVALCAVAHAAGQHDDLVIAILLTVLLMLEGEHRARDQRLAELITEVAGTVRSLDQNLLRRLVEPLTWLHV